MTDYSTMTQSDFDNILSEILDELTATDLLIQVPAIYSDLVEEFNNEILDRWAAEQERDED